MALGPPTTCRDFFAAARAEGYSRRAATWALYVALRRVIGLELHPTCGHEDDNPDVLLAELVSHLLDVDSRFAVLFDPFEEQASGRVVLADAWTELMNRPRGSTWSRNSWR